MWLQKGEELTDMIFIIQQLVKKSLEHKAKVFLTFIDLKKAYVLCAEECTMDSPKEVGRAGLYRSTRTIIPSRHASPDPPGR